MSYYGYLHSKHWKKMKGRLEARSGDKKCFICHSIYGVHTHHLTYKHLGHEKVKDLIFLCKKHHFAAHDLMDIGVPAKPAVAQLQREEDESFVSIIKTA